MEVLLKHPVNSGEAPRRVILSRDYYVTTEGLIISTKGKTERVLKPARTGSGKRKYLFVVLRVDGKNVQKYVHRAVAEAFIPNPEGKPQVNHKDGSTFNNAVDNLEWVTPMQNTQHAVLNGLTLSGEACPWSKLTEADVREACELISRGDLDSARKILGSKRLYKVKARKQWTSISKDYVW